MLIPGDQFTSGRSGRGSEQLRLQSGSSAVDHAGTPIPSWSTLLRLAFCGLALAAVPLIAGCASGKKHLDELSWCDDKDDDVVTSYRGYNARISHVCLDNVTDPAVQTSIEPRNVLRRVDDKICELTLNDAIQTALSNNEIVETASQGVGGSNVLNSPRAVASVYDPAIQESGVLFGGGLGVEAALSNFDTQFNTSALWGRSNATLVPRETASFTSALSKQFATGGTVQLAHNWNYLGTPGGAPFTSTYAGNIGLSVRQPLLAGGGVEFTRIAGPTNPAFGAITGVGQGVVIARINNDISIADFEQWVRRSVRDIENAYWDLYLAYRVFDTAVVAHRSARQTWRETHDKVDVGILEPAEELQTKDRLYETKANVEQSLSAIFRSESELRRLMGEPVNDGCVYRPSDEPAIAEYVPDWESSLQQGLRHRAELRAQKFRIKSLQLQLKAARSLVRPTVNAVGSYDINGVGDRLLDYNNTNPLSSGYGSMARANLETWTAGVEVTVPIGYRSQRSQVRNLELQLAKDTAVLAAQERNISHEIATAIQEVTAAFATAQSNHKRLKAATERLEKLGYKKELGASTLDLVLRAQASVAQAEGTYYQEVVNYNKALVNLNFAIGSLLEYNGVYLAEGGWCPEAQTDAVLRAADRTHAKPNHHLHSEPAEFISPGPTGTIERRPVTVPIADEMIVPEVPGDAEPMIDFDAAPDAPLDSEAPAADGDASLSGDAPADDGAPDADEAAASKGDTPASADGAPAEEAPASPDKKPSARQKAYDPPVEEDVDGI